MAWGVAEVWKVWRGVRGNVECGAGCRIWWRGVWWLGGEVLGVVIGRGGRCGVTRGVVARGMVIGAVWRRA